MNTPSTPPSPALLAIAARVDRESIARLTPLEIDYAMTLEGRRLLERVRLDGPEFRLSAMAKRWLEAEQS